MSSSFDQKLGRGRRSRDPRGGSRVRITATIENPLLPGRYAIVCWVAVLRNDEETAQQAIKLLNFVVFGIAKGQGIVSVPGELDVGLERAAHRRESVNAQPERLELREVSGPSALGGGWRRFGELLYLVSVTEFKKTYFGTVLGYLWSLLRPLLLFAVLLFVFTKIVRLGSGVPHYPVLLLMNVVLFGFFSEATTTAVMSVVNQECVVRKTQFPRLVIPLSVVMTALFNLGLNLIVVLIFILAFGVTPLWTWLLFPVIIALLFSLRHRRVDRSSPRSTSASATRRSSGRCSRRRSSTRRR